MRNKPLTVDINEEEICSVTHSCFSRFTMERTLKHFSSLKNQVNPTPTQGSEIQMDPHLTQVVLLFLASFLFFITLFFIIGAIVTHWQVKRPNPITVTI